MNKSIEAALLYADLAHEGQLRKGLPEEYIAHPRWVARMAAEVGLSTDAVVAAALHDTVEDTAVTFRDLEARFSPRAVRLVRLLTKWWPDDTSAELKAIYKAAYYAAIATDREAIALKKIDRAHNVLDMVKVARTRTSWARTYLAKTHTEVLRLPYWGHDVDAMLVDAVNQLENALPAVR